MFRQRARWQKKYGGDLLKTRVMDILGVCIYILLSKTAYMTEYTYLLVRATSCCKKQEKGWGRGEGSLKNIRLCEKKNALSYKKRRAFQTLKKLQLARNKINNMSSSRAQYLPFHLSALGQKPKVIASTASLSRRSLLSCCAIFSSPFCCAARVSASSVILPGTSLAVSAIQTQIYYYIHITIRSTSMY